MGHFFNDLSFVLKFLLPIVFLIKPNYCKFFPRSLTEFGWYSNFEINSGQYFEKNRVRPDETTDFFCKNSTCVLVRPNLNRGDISQIRTKK